MSNLPSRRRPLTAITRALDRVADHEILAASPHAPANVERDER